MAEAMTKEERAWFRKLQKLIDQTPERFGFYTIGDRDLTIFDRTNEHLFDENVDMVNEVHEYDASIATLKFKTAVHGVCG